MKTPHDINPESCAAPDTAVSDLLAENARLKEQLNFETARANKAKARQALRDALADPEPRPFKTDAHARELLPEVKT